MAVPEQTRRGPLAGLRVLELAGIGPGPFCAMLLADQGATVLRVDRPGGAPADKARPERDLMNRGRQSAVLDLKQPRAVDALLRLAEVADVLLEGLRPGVTERLGVGPEVCLRRNPRLVYARAQALEQHVSGVGQPEQGVHGARVLQVEHGGPAASVQELTLGMGRPGRRAGPVDARPVDTEHGRALVRQQHGAERPGPDARQFEHPQAGQRPAARWFRRHGDTSV